MNLIIHRYNELGPTKPLSTVPVSHYATCLDTRSSTPVRYDFGQNYLP